MIVIAGAAGSARAGGSVPSRPFAGSLPVSSSLRLYELHPSTQILWIAHMDANQLLAFDVVHRRVVKTIPAPGVHA